MKLDTSAWMEPDLCVLDSPEDFEPALARLIRQGQEHRTTLLYGWPPPLREPLERSIAGSARNRRTPRIHYIAACSSYQRLLRQLETLMESSPPEAPPGWYFVHAGALPEGARPGARAEYLAELTRLRNSASLQTVHIYDPRSVSEAELWRVLREHRAVWTGETSCESFYYAPDLYRNLPDDFPYVSDLKANLGHVRRQARMRAELVGSIVRAEAQLEARMREMQAVSRLAQSLTSADTLDDLLREGLMRVLEAVEMDAGAVLVQSPSDPSPKMRVQLTTPPLTEAMLGDFHAAMHRNRTLSLHSRMSWASDLGQSPHPELPPDGSIRSFLVVPLKVEGRLLGLVEAISDQPHTYSLQELHLVEVLASLMAAAVEMANLRQRVQAHELPDDDSPDRSADPRDRLGRQCLPPPNHEEPSC